MRCMLCKTSYGDVRLALLVDCRGMMHCSMCKELLGIGIGIGRRMGNFTLGLVSERAAGKARFYGTCNFLTCPWQKERSLSRNLLHTMHRSEMA